MEYKETLKELTELVSSYRTIRTGGSPEQIQELRDRLSEELFHFGPTYAEIRAASEKAESDYKSCLDEKNKHWKQKFGNKHGTAGLAENEARIECQSLQEALDAKNRDKYLASSLIDRTDQVLHSLSSRIKILSKHE